MSELHPEGVMDALRDMRRQVLESLVDDQTGCLKDDLAEDVPCYLCEAKDHEEELFFRDGFRFVRCKRCGLIYINPRVKDQVIPSLYNDERYNFMARELLLKSAKYRQERLYRERLRYIAAYRPTPGTLLEVGSANGHFLDSARALGWNVTGVEINRFGCEYARDALGLDNIHNCDLLDANFPSEAFDVVVMWDVLEHLPRPMATLCEVWRVLKLGGMVFIYVPNFDSVEVLFLSVHAPFFQGELHILYFTPATLQKMVEKASFVTRHQETHGLDVEKILSVFGEEAWKVFGMYHTEARQFVKANINELQNVINRAGRGNNLRLFAEKPVE
ncbi:class I SAM-dependent methyltransferase [Nitrospinae bacterium AH-259-F20]|nr:class I SAM-dependent methyltransferase [Nitrospinae bacterium AH-259-F20]